MKKTVSKLAYSIAFFILACNTQKSVDPTGKTPIPVGSDMTLDADTTSDNTDASKAIPDTLMKDTL